MRDIALVHATFGSADEAERIGRAMVETRRAACVNLLGACRSVYRWNGAVETGDEYRALFKTTPERARDLADAIAAAHSYDLPVVEIWPAAASDAIAQWVEAETR
ncbi:periplasmic divalent cation tolerance protein [Sphingomonas sp. BE123]|uniref:divalent-cation tolerance protein CutA n=1 Tax=unclassified Sphingomonas TaxID=196159 RepID=UPI00285F5CD6|nr:divalent-cation tolerance protein CutA [Sphingomonas sp. BE123]MDR6852075.1 periplasmic divalent cation tolerance protein [Sphingomonas sp. BE123]